MFENGVLRRILDLREEARGGRRILHNNELIIVIE
jgi:hypothetical protein